MQYMQYLQAQLCTCTCTVLIQTNKSNKSSQRRNPESLLTYHEFSSFNFSSSRFFSLFIPSPSLFFLQSSPRLSFSPLSHSTHSAQSFPSLPVSPHQYIHPYELSKYVHTVPHPAPHTVSHPVPHNTHKSTITWHDYNGDCDCDLNFHPAWSALHFAFCILHACRVCSRYAHLQGK